MLTIYARSSCNTFRLICYSTLGPVSA